MQERAYTRGVVVVAVDGEDRVGHVVVRVLVVHHPEPAAREERIEKGKRG
jgi:hypothetical protein